MDPELIPDPRETWWSAVVLAVLHRAGAATVCTLDPATLVVSLPYADGGWIRLQRCPGERWVLWGRSALAPPAPRDARREAPDWALSEATDEGRPTFVAWFAHGEWDAASVGDEGVPQLLRPLLSVDPRLAARARDGELAAGDLGPGERADLEAALCLVHAAHAKAPRLARGSVRNRLRDQVHDQMREARETDRMLLQQPPQIVAWARSHAPRTVFEHAVMLRRGVRIPALTNTALSRSVRRSLDHVLRDLHREEASDEHGAWLFARVRFDGDVVGFDRAFDHWPAWWRAVHPAQGHSLADLTWEMDQRAPAWRPPWASLLPRGVDAGQQL